MIASIELDRPGRAREPDVWQRNPEGVTDVR